MEAHRRYQSVAVRLRPWLGLAVLLFGLRVAAQYLELLWPAAPLPEFDAWSSGLIPYPQLFVLQCLLLWGMVHLCRSLPGIRPSPVLGRVLMYRALTYFSVMCLRFLTALFNLSHIRWFQLALPSFFHMVLAAYLGLVARFHLRGSQ
ncbi:hypothetical protein [Microbulbifer discodermiae]|uniref:hypothetical protein n=1 Tax=Microbulbifer sp. 2201CG32-9 TaxID=3232309 RepID=UPI00345C250D